MVVSQSNSSSNAASPVVNLNSNLSLSAELKYIADNANYRYFNANPSVTSANANYNSFYTSKANTSLDKFMQVENSLYNGQLVQAQLVNNAVVTVNAVEDNYKSFYKLYAKQLTGNFLATDSLTLTELAKLCPGYNGAVIYQARALYNLIYKTVKNYKENCDVSNGTGSRIMNIDKPQITTSWTVDLFPNPTNGELNIVSKSQSETLTVIIRDVAGKIVYNQNLLTADFLSKLDLNLISGIYLVTINNSKNESITKKLVITK